MIKREAGFSLIELLIVVLMIGFVLAAGSDMFISMLRGYKQQSKIAETSIEGVIGLEMLRRDIESAGYGLPSAFPAGYTYNEATDVTAAVYNDSTGANPPRPVVGGDGLSAAHIINGSDYLVLKAVNLARDEASSKWAYLLSSGVTTTWNPSTADLTDSDRVIVISPGTPAGGSRTLVAPTGGLLVQWSNVSAYASPNETRIIYGMARGDGAYALPLRMPFNRADYYVSATAPRPKRCASNTGILVKSIVNISDGSVADTMPLLDCVADMQVVYGLDPDEDGSVSYTPELNYLVGPNVGTPLTAADIRTQLKEVRVYVLSHEGERDPSYSHTPSIIKVGETGVGGRDLDIGSNLNYRWKLYTMVLRPHLR